MIVLLIFGEKVEWLPARLRPARSLHCGRRIPFTAALATFYGFRSRSALARTKDAPGFTAAALVGYFFDVPLPDALARNAAPPENERVPVPGIYSAAKRLQPPTIGEGFDALYRVSVIEGRFDVIPLIESPLLSGATF